VVRLNSDFSYQTLSQDPEKNKHPDFEKNKLRADLFAEEKDIYRRPEIKKKYDRLNHTISKIQSSTHCMFFTKIPAHTSSKTPISIPISYNCSNNEFEEKTNKAYIKLNMIMEN